MDVVRLRNLICTFAFAILSTACAKVTPVPNNLAAQEASCPNSILSTQFLVRWNDGHLSVETAESKDSFLNDFAKNHQNEISFIEYNTKIEVTPYADSLVHTAALNQDTYATEMIEAGSVWTAGFKGQGILVGVVDSAVDYHHVNIFPRLAQNTKEINGITGVDDDGNGLVDDKYGYDFANNMPEPTPQNHGTHVAGIIAADATVSNPMKSVAPQAQIIPANFMTSTSGDVATAITAMKYVVSRGARIINASWGGPACSSALSTEISALASQNVLFVSAAGNDGEDITLFNEWPAKFNLPAQLTVGANSYSGLQTSWSNSSATLVQFTAPGEDILSTVPGGYGYMSGTSMAAPVVSGAAALLWSARPQASVAQIKQALVSSVDANSSLTVSRGHINVRKALDALKRLVP